MRGPEAPARNTIETIWRIEAARLIGGLVRFVRSVDRADDLAQEALLAALERWPESGIPDNPGAWLMTTAKNRAVDEGRRISMMDARHRELECATESSTSIHLESLDEPVQDDALRLMLIARHPVLSKDARVALTLRLIAGLSTSEIARAFLTEEATIAQRIVRAKRTLTEAKVPSIRGIELRTFFTREHSDQPARLLSARCDRALPGSPTSDSRPETIHVYLFRKGFGAGPTCAGLWAGELVCGFLWDSGRANLHASVSKKCPDSLPRQRCARRFAGRARLREDCANGAGSHARELRNRTRLPHCVSESTERISADNGAPRIRDSTGFLARAGWHRASATALALSDEHQFAGSPAPRRFM
jgi:RNA polymerase sigma factor (sigma-70 family)